MRRVKWVEYDTFTGKVLTAGICTDTIFKNFETKKDKDFIEVNSINNIINKWVVNGQLADTPPN